MFFNVIMRAAVTVIFCVFTLIAEPLPVKLITGSGAIWFFFLFLSAMKKWRNPK